MSLDRQRGLPEGPARTAVSDFLAGTLKSIPRSDQRRWGEVYVRGLLEVDGKKTMRALAHRAGGGIEQSLYQFISKSPWESRPVRQELARTVQRAAAPRAWVVHALDVAKAGDHSVGVQRQFVPSAGRVLNCQRSIGVWLASDELSCPVDWRLSLPDAWVREPLARKRASIPDGVRACPPEQCAVGSVAAIADGWGLPGRPVVMDLGETDPYPVCAQLVELQVPFVVRVDPWRPFTAMDMGLAPLTRDDAAWPNGLVAALSRRSVPVEWLDHRTDEVRANQVGAVPVRLRGSQERPDQPRLSLLGAWTGAKERLPGEFWVTNLPPSQLGTAYRTAMLTRRVERDLAEVADPLGLRDFEGRSYRGWHHHMTMVSLAHALTVLGRTSRAGERAAAAPAGIGLPRTSGLAA